MIHKENEGLGPTRNAGIRAATGDFVYHCDSDDWLREDLLEKAYRAITEADAQVLVFGYDIFTEENGQLLPYDSIKVGNNIYQGQQEVRRFFVDQYFHSFVVLSACNRMYRRSFLIENELYFPDFRRSQDMAYSLLLFDRIEKLVTIEQAFYCYIIEPGYYKGRSYQEMVDIYSKVYDMTVQYFEKWGLHTGTAKQKLTDNVCEQIANYSAHAFAVKYPEQWKENAKHLLQNREIQQYFKKYGNLKKSRFMTFFSMGMRLRSKLVLYAVSRFVNRKINGA